jgi:hypothetical protein
VHDPSKAPSDVPKSTPPPSQPTLPQTTNSVPPNTQQDHSPAIDPSQYLDDGDDVDNEGSADNDHRSKNNHTRRDQDSSTPSNRPGLGTKQPSSKLSSSNPNPQKSTVNSGAMKDIVDKRSANQGGGRGGGGSVSSAGGGSDVFGDDSERDESPAPSPMKNPKQFLKPSPQQQRRPLERQVSRGTGAKTAGKQQPQLRKRMLLFFLKNISEL